MLETIHQARRQLGPGRPGRYTRYRIVESSTFEVEASANVELIEAEVAGDGCFPLVTNDHSRDAAALLAAYKYQPQLEKRHSYFKSVLEVTPVWLKSPARVEGLLCCYFVALFLHALIERQLRAAMRQRTPTQTLPIYPEQRPCSAPTTEQVLRVFSTLQRHWVRRGERIDVFLPELNHLQIEILDLLGVSQAGWLSDCPS